MTATSASQPTRRCHKSICMKCSFALNVLETTLNRRSVGGIVFPRNIERSPGRAGGYLLPARVANLNIIHGYQDLPPIIQPHRIYFAALLDLMSCAFQHLPFDLRKCRFLAGQK